MLHQVLPQCCVVLYEQFGKTIDTHMPQNFNHVGQDLSSKLCRHVLDASSNADTTITTIMSSWGIELRDRQFHSHCDLAHICHGCHN